MNDSKLSMGTTFFIVLLLFPHYQLLYLELFPVINRTYDALRVISSLSIITIIIYDIFKNDIIRKSHFWALLLLCFYYAEVLICTAYNHVSLKDIILRIVSQLSVFLICFFFAANFHKELLKALLVISEILTYSNFIVILFNRNGLYRTTLYWNNWLLGYKNNFFQYFIGFIVASYLYTRYFKNSLRVIILNITMLLSVAIVGSTTALWAMLMFYFLAFVAKFDGGKIIHSYNLSTANIVLFFTVVVLKSNGLFGILNTRFPGKTTAVLLRFKLWDRTWALIKQSLWKGYGYRSSFDMTTLLGAKWATHAHNIVLQVLLEGGVLSLILYLLFNLVMLKEIYKYKNTYVAQIMAIGMFVLYMSSLFEVYYKASTFVIFGLASSVGTMAQLNSEQEYEYRYKVRIVSGKKV